jgi:steroid delta-isomerase-like uncharacterized protein
VHAPTIKIHYPGGVDDASAKSLRDDLAALKKANPDLHAEIHSIFGAGDLVVTDLTWTASHTGDYFGIPATGKTAMHNGIVVRRLEDGKIVESWEVFDDLAFLQGLGYLPSWDDIIAQGPIEVEPATAALKSGDIAGVWRGAASGVPGDPATSFWRFNADGTYQVAFTLDQIKENGFVETGSFKIEGDKLTLEASTGCIDTAAEKIGVYTVSLDSGRLLLKVESDSCTGRKNSLRAAMPSVKP